MEGILAILLPIIISLGAFAMVAIIRKFENAERMKMIEMGVTPQDMVEPPKQKGILLKFALISAGIGIGLLVGSVLDAYTTFDSQIAYFSMCFVFGGIGLFAADQVMQKRFRETEEREREEQKNSDTPKEPES